MVRYVTINKNPYMNKICTLCKSIIPISTSYWYYCDTVEKHITKVSVRVCANCVSLDEKNKKKVYKIGDDVNSLKEL